MKNISLPRFFYLGKLKNIFFIWFCHKFCTRLLQFWASKGYYYRKKHCQLNVKSLHGKFSWNDNCFRYSRTFPTSQISVYPGFSGLLSKTSPSKLLTKCICPTGALFTNSWEAEMADLYSATYQWANLFSNNSAKKY